MSDIARTSGNKSNATMVERAFRRLIGFVDAGALSLKLPGTDGFSLRGTRRGPCADVEFKRWRGLARLLTSGDIGFAAGYRAGDWDTSDLVALLSWAMQNEVAIASATGGNSLSRALDLMRHRAHRNSRPNSRRNIAAHYDLGNDFYALWLDAGMNYSSGLYRSADDDLEVAQVQKIDRVCELLKLQGGERVLEIGCGWGAIAERLTASHRCKVTGVTLSHPQQVFAQERLRRLNEPQDAEILLQDYRDIDGRFDRIVSIEMLEAVGEEYWRRYFAKLRECLAPGGIAVLQVITIAPERYAAYRGRPDFIQLQIFPGGALPTSEIIDLQAASVGLKVTSNEMFGASYARTLTDWRRRFNAAWNEIAALGFDESFQRLWNYYLAYCEVGFTTGALDVGLYKMEHRQS